MLLERIVFLVNRVIKYIYFSEVFYIYKHVDPVLVSSPVKIDKVTLDNLFDARNFNEEKYIDEFKNFLSRGDLGYYAYIDDKCVHRSWVRTGPLSMEVIKGYHLTLNATDAYIHYCATAENVRGNNIYPYTLNFIINELNSKGYKNIFMLVLEKKKSARRGVEKAGFIKHKFISIIRILGITFIKELPMK